MSSSNKRKAFDLNEVLSQRQKLVNKTSGPGGGSASSSRRHTTNDFIKQPIQPKQALPEFFHSCRVAALQFLPSEQRQTTIATPFCEIEARLGILRPHTAQRRVVSPKGDLGLDGDQQPVFDCGENMVKLESGVSRRHFWQKTGTGVSTINELTRALKVTDASELHKGSSSNKNNHPIHVQSLTETVYSGYPDNRRICFPGLHPEATEGKGTMETKEKRRTLNLAMPTASYDVRATLSTEKVLPLEKYEDPVKGWKIKRVKRRQSYWRTDGTVVWQIDVTEVTTSTNPTRGPIETSVEHEIEVELQSQYMLQLLNASNPDEINGLANMFAEQLWHVISSLNPMADAVDVDDMLEDHPDHGAVTLALAQCEALARNRRSHGSTHYESPLRNPGGDVSYMAQRHNFMGCMPVNFSRHNLEEIQKMPSSAYFCSEKTDGVRHFLVFVGHTAVLIDRAKKGKRPIPLVHVEEAPQDPFASILPLITPGTVLDGEVVINRKGAPKPRPIFIVFDVLSVSPTESIMHLNFEQRLVHMKKATFRTPTANRDMFDEKNINDPHVPLPLVRKNFVPRTEIDYLCGFVSEERGMRIYSNGKAHNHLTDGIIFQPNTPYVCGTDNKLLKWKYLDTVTIDVELMPPQHDDDDNVLRTACLGESDTRIDLTRFVKLPFYERLRMEADKYVAMLEGHAAKIAEVGLDPETGEWYYVTFRHDKLIPNHIKTVLGSSMELAEHVTTEELRYRMSIPEGARDVFPRDLRSMMTQLLQHQRKRNNTFRKDLENSTS